MKNRRWWLGGYVRKTKSGRQVYVIERWHRGERVHVSTGCSTKEGALKELARFEEDPVHYQPGGNFEDKLMLTAELVEDYRLHQVEKGLSPEWIDEVGRCLAAWTLALGDADLRKLELLQLTGALDAWQKKGLGSRAARMKAIKGLFHWMREKGRVERGQDPTMDLRVPQAAPEKQKRRKVVAPEAAQVVLEQLAAQLLNRLAPLTRDMMLFLSATGWHVSELRRFHAEGEIVEVAPIAAGGPIAVLITRHKSGDLNKTPITYPEHLEVAKRIRAAKHLPTRATTARHVREAITAIREQQEKDGVPEAKRMGRFILGAMRHNVLTWGVRAGASIQAASEFANHRSTATTKRFYVDLDLPTASIPIQRLAPKG